ncbi:helix-turn-helix domain-containing protein [Weissella cibaria]|uniref:helix-turn-helix domain-containing protein n=1 Tax=Weissella cibaria TaxID=137591 RepID=UPI0007A6264A|nr:helix-turn-helix transcriptional regulator [Weissella cibaria]
MTFYERVYETAKLRGLSIKKLADKIGVSDATIYTWKRTGAPTGKNLTAVSEALGVSIDYLLGNTNEMHSNKKDDKSEIDLDKALADQGVVMRYQGKELSDKAKRGILEILKLVDGDED